MLYFLRKYRAAVLTFIFITILTFLNINTCRADEVIVGEPIRLEYDRNNSYENYIKKNSKAPSPRREVLVKGSDYSNTGDTSIRVLDDYMGRNKVLFWPANPTWFQWNVNIEDAGLYNISISYNPGTEVKNDIDLKLEINGEIPFNEVASNKLVRVWRDSTGIIKDERGNELRPKLETVESWQEYDIKDNRGLYLEPFKIYLNKGNNVIRLTSNGEPFMMDYIKIHHEEEPKSYKEVAAQYSGEDYKEAKGGLIKVQAENAGLRSSSVLNTGFDRSSPATEPSHVSKIRMNTINPNYWKEPGQWITWDFKIEESGLYRIGIKYRQNVNPGLFSSRKILIDGKVPFKELEAVKFGYDYDWDMKVLGDEEPYLFYLEKGAHELTMEVTLGDMTDILRKLQDDLYSLNEIYRRIIMMTGESPDTFRDYQFEKWIPGLEDTLKGIADNLERENKRLREVSGTNAGDAAFLTEFAFQLRDMAKDTSTIAVRLDNFKAKIGSLGTIILKDTQQPLELDYLVVAPKNVKMPSVKANFFQSAAFSVKAFIASFFEDYNIISNKIENDKPTVKVWVGLGRDQVGIIKDMINDIFTPKTGINVQLELVQGSLIEATLAGRGPDVALMVGQSDPLNYAIRGALVDLKSFKDFDEVAKRFYPSAITPFEFRGKTYALPDQQTFDMLFYRTDILKQLKLGVPQSWGDFDRMIPILQENNLQSGISSGLFPALIYQRGGKYYKDSLKETAFDTKEAEEAFKQLTDYYVSYNFPLEYNGYNRFRTGEMPLLVAPYTLYNQLSVAAPEIKGLWGMAQIPGMTDVKGNINRSTGSGVSACIMFEKTKNKDAAWEFLKWFTSAEVQARYGIELEAIMGAAARYNTANKEAFTKLPWTKAEQELLKSQWENVKGIPETPGSYYITRGFQNAFRSTTINYENPYESLAYWNREINIEIKRKFEEFGLD